MLFPLLGFNPVWNESTEFQLTKPELDMLTIVVKDRDRVSTDFIGWHFIPITSLKPGTISLHKKYLFKSSSTKNVF